MRRIVVVVAACSCRHRANNGIAHSFPTPPFHEISVFHIDKTLSQQKIHDFQRAMRLPSIVLSTHKHIRFRFYWKGSFVCSCALFDYDVFKAKYESTLYHYSHLVCVCDGQHFVTVICFAWSSNLWTIAVVANMYRAVCDALNWFIHATE